MKKLRGHKRIFKNIQTWQNDSIDLDLENLEQFQRNYEKVWVHPFSDISITGKEIPRPKRKARKLILESLVAVFNSWDRQLKTLNKQYYLAIWLYEPYIENSQVVCAIDGYLDYYDNHFYRPEVPKKMPAENYGKLKNELDAFNWVYALDEGHFTDEDINDDVEVYATEKDYYKMKKWYARKLKENPRTFTDDFKRTTYFTKRGAIWIGTK